MAAPMVAGVAAIYLQNHPNASASTVGAAVMSVATTGVLDTLDTTSPNKLLYSLVNGGVSPTPTPTPTPVATPTPGPTVTPTPAPQSVKVTVKKRAQNATTTATTQFGYSAVNLSTSSFSLTPDQDFIDPNAQPGTNSNPIVITETPVDGWQLMSISCVDPTTGAPATGTINVANRTASLVAAPAQQVECTFTSELISPTAAPATISGQVVDGNGRGVRNISLALIDPIEGQTRYVRTNSFGYYYFDDVAVEHTYVLTAYSTKRYQITSPTRVITPTDDVGDVNFFTESN